MKRFLFPLFACATLFTSCTSSTIITGSWSSKDLPKGKKYKSVFIAALVENKELKATLENNLAAEAQKRHLRVVKSMDVFAPNFTKENAPSKEEMLKVIKKKDCDAIFTVTYLDTKTESRYVPGGPMYNPYPTFGYYGGWYGYYGYYYPQLYDPGYYTTDKMYYLESNLFDADTEKILWSAQSETTNPASASDFSKDYVKAVVNELVSKGFLERVK